MALSLSSARWHSDSEVEVNYQMGIRGALEDLSKFASDGGSTLCMSKLTHQR